MIKPFCFFLLFLFLSIASFAQLKKDGLHVGYIENGDTIFMHTLEEVEITASKIFNGKQNAKRYRRLVYYVKKVYPYAKIASIKMLEYEDILSQTKSKRKRKKIMRQAEKEMKAEFEEDLQSLTYMQGEILLKLIDRETNQASYYLLKELRGGFRASFYQGFARLFGFNLKERYDPNGRDKEIEEIVLMIEAGKI